MGEGFIEVFLFREILGIWGGEGLEWGVDGEGMKVEWVEASFVKLRCFDFIV